MTTFTNELKKAVLGANNVQQVEAKGLLEQARNSKKEMKSTIVLTPERNIELFSKETGDGLVITRTEDILGGAQVLFYNGADRDLAVGPLTTQMKRLSFAIGLHNADKDDEIVPVEVLSLAFNLKQWYEIDEDGKMARKKNVVKDMRYGIMKEGKRVSRLDLQDITRFSVETESGYKARVRAISNKILVKFDREILSRIDLLKQTYADIKLLIRDMQDVGRNLQESSIDVDKKYSLVIPMKLAKYVNKDSKAMSSYLKKNGKDIIKSNIDELVNGIKNNNDVSDYSYAVTLDTTVDLIADGGRYWETISKSQEKVINEVVVPLVKESSMVSEMNKLIAIGTFRKGFTTYCKQMLDSYRSYAWNVKFNGEEEDDQLLINKANNHDEIRIAFKCTIQETGREIGLNDNEILACVVTADCIDNHGQISLKNETMVGRQLFKHEFAAFYSELGRSMKVGDEIINMPKEKVYFGETKVYGVSEEVLDILTTLEEENKEAVSKFSSDLTACVNKEEGAYASVSEIPVPQPKALEVEFVDGYALINDETIFARGMNGTAYLFLKGRAVVASKEYNPIELAKEEKFDGRLLIIDKCINQNALNKYPSTYTNLDYMDVRYYTAKKSEDGSVALQNDNSIELAKSMNIIKKFLDKAGNQIKCTNTINRNARIKNNISVVINDREISIATFVSHGSLDRLKSLIGKEKANATIANKGMEYVENALALRDEATTTPLGSYATVEKFEYVEGYAFMILK